VSIIAADRKCGEPPVERSYLSGRIDRLVDALCLLGMALAVLLLAASVTAFGLFAYLRSPLALQSPIETSAEADGSATVGEASELLPCDATHQSTLPVDPGTAAPQPCPTPDVRYAVPMTLPAGGTPTVAAGQGLPEVVVAGLEWGQSFPLSLVGAMSRSSLPAGPLRPISYRVAAGDSLSSIAAAFGVTPETVLWANSIKNPELLLAGQELKILPVSGVLHRVVRGDTLPTVAEMYVVDQRAILEANALSEGTALQEGQELVIPGGILRTTELLDGPPAPPPAAEIQAATKYTVKDGDSLGSIADSFGVLPSTIQAANDLMNPDRLSIGQTLAIPGARAGSPQGGQGETQPRPTVAAVEAAPPAPPAAVPTATPVPPAPTAAAAVSGAQYTVKGGDTLYSIARAYGVKAQSVQDANGLSDASKLKLGQTLLIPGVAADAQPQSIAAAAAPTSAPTQTAAPAATNTAVPLPPTATPVPPKPAAAQPTPKPATAPAPSTGGPLGSRVAAIAQKYVGYRYIWGGHSPDGFDCSGFTWYVYREAGYNIPLHDLNGQLNTGQKIALDKLAPGDMVFFQNTYTKGLSHAGIYLGGGRFINAESEKVGVQVRSISDPFWASRFVGASRPPQ
jgi:cell wall-associated NlpC family hydrolase